MKNTARGGCVERLIQHEAKPSAVFASRYSPSAVLFIHTSIGSALIVIPYNGNSSRKKMFANFVNVRVFANIFLLNFHFLVLFMRAQR